MREVAPPSKPKGLGQQQRKQAMNKEELIQIIEDALEEKWLNLRDYSEEEADEFKRAWDAVEITIKGDK